MSNHKWWNEDELPPPSMRQNYVANPLRRLSRSPRRLRRFSPKIPRKSNQSERGNSFDRNLQQRLVNLRTSKSENQIGTVESLEERARKLKMNGESSEHTPSVSNIEERLARLRGVSVEEIRNPKTLILKTNKHEEETVEKLMKRARDEAKIEEKWDHCSRKSKWEDNIDPEEFIGKSKDGTTFSDDLNGKPSTSDASIMLGHDTIRNLKDLRRTMKLAEQRSKKAAALTNVGTDDQSMDDEMKELMKLTRQSSLKSEKISEELSKFWEERLNHQKSSVESNSNSDHSDDIGISDEELQRVIMEAEQAENEVKKAVKESKKNTKKGSIFSRIFRN